jgi:hypothetical protein
MPLHIMLAYKMRREAKEERRTASFGYLLAKPRSLTDTLCRFSPGKAALSMLEVLVRMLLAKHRTLDMIVDVYGC